MPPTREGLLHPTDVARLAGFRARISALFERDLASRAPRWSVTEAPWQELLIDLGQATRISVARLEEDITRGQHVARYTLYGETDSGWRVLSQGTTIGYAKLDRFSPVAVRQVRLEIDDAIAKPELITLKLYAASR